jgi:hypothetical protein
MSELLQSGQQPGASGPPDPYGHPDADQLSAFLEHALPAHERDHVLAHLAVCLDCRETVALASPPVDAAQAPVAASARKPWFAGWTVFLPAAVALTALALFIVYINHEPAGPGRQQAQNATVPTMAPTAPHDQPGSAATGAASNTQLSAAPRLEPPKPVQGASDEKKTASAIAIDKIAQLPITNRAVAGFSDVSPPAPAPAAAKTGQGTASGAGVADGLGSGYGSAAAPAPAFAGARMEPAPVAVPPPPSPQRPPEPKAAPAATETVQVSSAAAPIETVNAELKNTIQPADRVQPPVLRHQLPSRLTVLSLANAGSRVLAIDARNAVFLSADAGRHWKPVQIPWQGRAVKAELVSQVEVQSSPAGSLHGPALDRLAGRDLSPVASLSGKVTDRSGAVVSGATVVVTGGSISTARTVRTDASGRYLAAGLSPGAYKVEAQAPGFQLQSLNGVTVDASRPNLANLTLDVGSAAETVTVDAAAQAPLKSARGQFSAITTAPAVLQAPPVFAITTDTGERWTSVDGSTWKRD